MHVSRTRTSQSNQVVTHKNVLSLKKCRKSSANEIFHVHEKGTNLLQFRWPQIFRNAPEFLMESEMQIGNFDFSIG